MTAGIRRAEMIGVLASATALALGHRPATLLLGTVLSVRFAQRLRWSQVDIATVYWYGLVRFAGCHAENHGWSALIGDEIAFNREYSWFDFGRQDEMIGLVVAKVQKAHAELGPAGVEALLKASAAGLGEGAAQMIAGHCDVAQRLATRLGFDPAIVHALGQFRERWDGAGLPRQLRGEALDPAVRLVFLCHDVAMLSALVNRDAALTAVERRSGSAYEPALAEAFLAHRDELMAVLDASDPWMAAMDAEPGGPAMLSATEVEDACLVMADFCDLQLPDATDHSRTVAVLATQAAKEIGLDATTVEAVHRAGLLHDLGYSAVPVRLRGGHVDTLHAEGEVRLHPFHSEDLLRRVPSLKQEAELVGRHHETSDGSGYFRGLNGQALSAAARVLIAAEAYQTLIEGRRGAAALPAAEAATVLKAAITTGRIDPEAGRAVLAAAGHRVAPKRRDLVAGLTNRELDILRLAASGLSMKQIGERLGIAPKTVDNHLQSIYAKIEVKTRAGAMLFAIAHGLCARN